MSDVIDPAAPNGTVSNSLRPQTGERLPAPARYAVSLALVVVTTILAFVVEHLIAAPNLTLLFVLPVVISATSFGWGPSLLTVAASTIAFDFFFTEPRLSLAIASPSDLWAAALLLVTAGIVSTVAAESRRRAREAQRAAEQAEALQALAHLLITGRPIEEVVEAAAMALNRSFRAPAAILAAEGDGLQPLALAGGARLEGADRDAARTALESNAPTRAGTYPDDAASFDFWPLKAASGRRYALGVDFTRADESRPEAAGRTVELIGAYLATASG